MVNPKELGLKEFHELFDDVDFLRKVIILSNAINVKMDTTCNGKNASIEIRVPITSWISIDSKFLKIGTKELYIVANNKTTILVIENMCYINNDYNQLDGKICVISNEICDEDDIKAIMKQDCIQCTTDFKFKFGKTEKTGIITDIENIRDMILKGLGGAMAFIMDYTLENGDVKKQHILFVKSNTMQINQRFFRIDNKTKDEHSIILIDKQKFLYVLANKLNLDFTIADKITTKVAFEMDLNTKEIRILDCYDVDKYMNDLFILKFFAREDNETIIDQKFIELDYTKFFKGKLDKMLVKSLW